jgi:2-amino-4-hydroxy-6-hydroxymethyldihydropteridine diphosphokinase
MARKGSDDQPAMTDNPDMTRSFVGLGANLESPQRQIERALELLEAEDGVEVAAVSTLRWTDPVGFEDQPRFLNGAAELRTTLGAGELLERLLGIERLLGRVRGEGPRFGPRTIDLDLLLHGQEMIDEPGLQVPHPRLHERRFVLEPLAELDPALEIPGLGPVQTLLAGL